MNQASILAKKYLENHKNPIRKLDLPGHKLFLPKATEEEAELVRSGLCVIKHALEHERVERRCARATASWLPDQNLAKIHKSNKTINTYGFGNKDGRFLYPEEALLLLEMNRLELFHNNIPISIQEAYEILLSTKIELNKYLAYRKLGFQGFRCVRGNHPSKINEKQYYVPLKRCRLENEPENTTLPGTCDKDKPSCRLSNDGAQAGTSGNSNSNGLLTEMFKRLQDSGPKHCSDISISDYSNYKIFCPENTNRKEHNFKLCISEDKNFNPKLGFTSTPTIVNYAGSEFSGYFQIAQVDLPTLYDFH